MTGKTYWALAAALLALSNLGAQSETQSVRADCACCSDEHRAFDFWVGEWEVLSPEGKPAGTNRIEKMEGGCVLQEYWTGASGDTGTSLNFYNTANGQWEQLWIDNSGRALKLAGQGNGERMVLSSEPFRDAKGHTRIHRITWTAAQDGSVRQLWEVLEGDQVVSTVFDGIYRKKG